jgi:diguanylate cyclase (GGDEF)-like protein
METEEILTLAVDSGSLTRQDARDLIDRQDDLIGFRQPGSLLWELSDGRTISLVHQPIPNGWRIATLQDITEGRQAAATIAHMTRHDALTGLPNRVQFRDHLGQSLSLVRRGEPLAVLCLDLDHFKGVNDTLGHPTGDLLLQAVAERLRASLRPTDMIARLGGDEFAIVQQSLALVEDATALAGRILDIVGAPYDLDGHKVVVATSVGVALAPADGVDPDRLLKNADMALYRAKAEGRGTYRFFEPEMDARMQARRALELDLRSAVGAGQFELFYQPIVDARSERTTGFEALLRWRHPQRGMVSPVDFIALTEETGLIVPLGEWVLRQACEEAARWPDDLRVAVNLSPAQFKCRNLVEVVLSALAGSGLPPGRLELEITETVLLQENDTNLATLHQLRSLGVRISMDDFGTGYSSLSYLRSFPFDKIKIDRSFIRDSAERSDCLAIIRAVAGLGSSLGIGTLAEGVETAEQLRCIQAEGCTEVQGYYFSPPVPAHGIARLLERTGWPRRAVA